MQNSASTPTAPVRKTGISLTDLWPWYKVREFTTKIFHRWEEIGIWNLSSLDPFMEMKNRGMDFEVSCLIKRTQEIVSISLQEIEFKPQN
ncbi:MAG: hypothetical protein ACD_2C00173G0003 [uncultured bacterium (gcode 4)]|uniref:Uncharacterized protein n=1 Tax=uncultured bacterium (gcode 4) TaxID=1234023 RepID=K2G584_9BACT|nr:MAG: hypothetical protein ACD_2C00173G0003 [uncultured bacterium (gcode 4)]